MKVKLGKFFLIAVLMPIFLFLLAKEVDAKCPPAGDMGCIWEAAGHRPDICPGASPECDLGGSGKCYACFKCDGDYLSLYGCGNCNTCGGGGGLPDTVKPQCGVRIEPYTASGNLVANPGFEIAGGCSTSGWSTSFETTKKWRRSLPCSIRGSGSFSATQNISVDSGAIYEITLYGRASRDYGCDGWGNTTVKIDGGPGGIHGYEVANGKYGDTGWQEFKTTYYAHDSTLTLELKGHMENESGCWFAFAAFDDISVVKIEGAESSSGENVVNLRIGAWDDRNNFPFRRIRNDDTDWLDDFADWEDFGVSGAANNISWPLGGTGTVYVQVMDRKGNISNFCSDSIGVNQAPECASFSVPTPIYQGDVVNVDITGTDPEGNLSSIGAYYSPTSNQDWNQIDGTQNCSGSTCSVSIPWDTSPVALGSYYVVGNIYDADAGQCSGNPWTPLPLGWSECPACGVIRTIEEPIIISDAWYQSEGGDVHADDSGGGDIQSLIPQDCVDADDAVCDANFSLPGATGQPGVVSYSTGGGADFGDGFCSNDSKTHWLAESDYEGDEGDRYDFAYFYGLVGSPTKISVPDGTAINQETLDTDFSEEGIVAYEGSIETGSTWNMTDKPKGVIFIDGKFLLQHRIISDPGESIIVIATGGIGISDGYVAELGNPANAVFITDGVFYSGVDPTAFPGSFSPGEAGKKLTIEGSVIAWGGFNFSGRDFSFSDEPAEQIKNNTEPVEFYRYDPSLLLDSNEKLWKAGFTWQELAP